ncbi:MAG TPA: serine/threonine-protein kinase, partial [Pirellulales bacterium]
MPLVKEQHAEPIPGYRLIDRLGSGGFGEVWKCEAPGGLFKAIKFVYGNLNGLETHRAQAAEELKAIQRVKTIRHPFLLSMDRVEVIAGELLIVTELADKSLYDLLQERRQAGHAGIPRSELFAYLREAAEVLDLLNFQYELQHLDVKPHNLFLVSNHVKVADFGLVSSLGSNGGTGAVQIGAVTPLYASPEIFLGNISRQSDQYSLAIVYQELLTGSLPFQGKNARQLLLQHTKQEPDLSALPEGDRAVVARALSKVPAERFRTCLDFVRALRSVPARPHALADGAGGHDLHPGWRTDVEADFGAAAVPSPMQQADTDADRALEVTPSAVPVSATSSCTRQAPPVVNGKLAGYRFLECLGSSPLADVWRAQVSGGQPRLVKFVYGAAGRDSRRLEDAIVRYKLLLHPALIQGEVVQCDPGRLVLVADPTEESLRERWQQCQARGQAGVPRDELLGYLRVAAEALDYLYQQHSIQHLGLN